MKAEPGSAVNAGIQTEGRMARATGLPSVEDWISAGGRIERVTAPPRAEKCRDSAEIGPGNNRRRA